LIYEGSSVEGERFAKREKEKVKGRVRSGDEVKKFDADFLR
jgi:hypothetical protein